MDNIKNYLVAAVVTGVVVVIGVVVFQKVPVVNNTVNVPEQQPPLGAMPGSSLEGNSWTVGGFEEKPYSFAFTKASTTLCMIRVPNATSTLVFASARVASSSIAAFDLEWGTSLAQNSTSTSLGQFSFAASQKGIAMASTSQAFSPGGIPIQIDNVLALAPNTYLTLKTGASVGGAGSLTGMCKIKLIVN